MKLTASTQEFILHWGEMGTRWGTNRTVSQIFALLYLSEKPLSAEVIAETLSVARSNVSTSLRELESWGVLKTVTMLGDRKEYFTTLDDIWEMFRIILAERKKREIDPTLAVIRECKIASEEDSKTDAHAARRFREMDEFFTLAMSWYEQMNKLSTENVVRAMKAGDKMLSLLGKKRD